MRLRLPQPSPQPVGLPPLRQRPEDFEPLSRERLTAGSMLPANWYVRAQRFRRWFQESARELFSRYDLLLAPATPCTATPIGATRRFPGCGW